MPSDTLAPRTQIDPPSLPGIDSLLTLISGVVVVATLYFAKEVLIPITLAVILSFLLAPLVSVLRRLRLGHTISVLLAVILALGVISALGTIIGSQIAGLSSHAAQYEAAIGKKVSTLRHGTLGRVDKLIEQLQANRNPAPPPASTPQAAPAPAGSAQNPVDVRVQPGPPTAMEILRDVLGRVAGPVGTTILVLIIAVFILMQQTDLRDRLIRLFGSNDLHRTTLALNDAAARLSTYFLTQLAINTGFGIVVGTGLFLIGVPSPVLWGLLSMLLRFIPYVGSYLAGFLPALLAAGVDASWSMALWTVALYFVVESTIGQVVEPLAYGHSTGLSPISVVFATIFWAWIWGPIGLLLATPLTLCLVVLGRHVKRLEFLDVLLGDRPALTPAESLYQRLLANDPDEAATQAELILREKPLAAYYDEVAIPSLQFAAADAARGVLARDKQALMRDAMQGVIEDLDDHTDVVPPPREPEDGAATVVPVGRPPRPFTIDRVPPGPEARSGLWAAEAPVLCVGGRTPVDDAAAAMLTQLLIKHGLGATLAPHETVTRATLAALARATPAAIAICYMEATGSPAHLRVLIHRLRAKFPGALVLLALWPSDTPTPPDRDLREAAKADIEAGSLRDAATACIEAACKSSGIEQTAAA